MNKLILFFDLFRKGAVVSDPATLKNKSALIIALSGLIPVLLSIARGFGYDIQISDEDIAKLAAGVAVVVGLFSTYATSDKVGLLPARPVPPDSFPALDAEQPAATERRSAEPYNAERGS